MSKLTMRKNGQLQKSKNGKKDEFGLNDILSQIGVPDADLGKNLGNDLVEDLNEEKEESIVEPKKRKSRTKKISQEEKDYVTAKVERPILDLIPYTYLKDLQLLELYLVRLLEIRFLVI